MVFFCDLKIEENKVSEIVGRYNYDYNTSKKLYTLIDNGMTFNDVAKKVSLMALFTSFYEMDEIAKEIGQMYYAVERECDVELAKYAASHDVLAVISNDTDFLIFPGEWKLWSAQDIRQIKINQSRQKRIKTVEYNRYAIGNICSLGQHQLPLFATIMGNDITEKYTKKLTEICKNFDPNASKGRNAASIVQNIYASMDSTSVDIKHVVKFLFGHTSNEKEELFQQSIDSYNIDYTPRIIDHPIEMKMLNTKIYRQYMDTLNPIIEIFLPFYDMRGCEDSSTLPRMFIEWTKRKVGIVCHQNKQYTFKVLTKKSMDETYQVFEETPIFSTCKSYT